MLGVLLIFSVPMILSAALISPPALHDLVHGLPYYAIMGLILPFAAWPVFLTTFVFPTSGSGRIGAVIKVWLGGTVMVAAVINLLYAAMSYSPIRPGPNPRAGFLLAGLVLCMLVSCGVWGAFAPILPREVPIRGALATGFLLFLAVAALGFLVAG
jgi:hypothetical protein